MDEPTAALDARVEHRIYTRLKALADGRSTVFIIHRLANRIVVLDQGRVFEMGTHDELINQAGGISKCTRRARDRHGVRATAPDLPERPAVPRLLLDAGVTPGTDPAPEPGRLAPRSRRSTAARRCT